MVNGEGGDRQAPGAAQARGYRRAWDELNAGMPGLDTDRGWPLTRIMYVVWMARGDLQDAYDLTRRSGRNGFADWFLAQAAKEFDLPAELIPRGTADGAELPVLQPRVTDLAAAPEDGDVLRLQPHWLQALWHHRRDLHGHFRVGRWAGGRAFLRWLVDYGMDEHAIPAEWVAGACLRAGALDLAARALKAYRPRGRAADAPGALPAPPSSMTRTPVPEADLPPPGVNLVGYARGVLGLGEDVRTAALAMRAADVRFGVYNFTRNLFTAQSDTSADAWLTDRLDYRANLFCMSGQEAPTVFLTLGREAFDRRYNIGYWAWELPEWPDAWRHCFWFVDEIWTSSRYTQQALAAKAPVPVRRMPLAVTVEPPGRAGRSDFGLPDEAYLFLFAFDVNSHWARKNPWAAIDAFRRAFPNGDEPAGLVLKVMNARSEGPEWRRFQEAAAADRRIRLISRTLDRGEMHDLVELCDAYVSLHRSEGFGRGPAEAMRLGKPVVVTNYSGNTDFTLPDTACLVDYELVPVGEGEYWGGAGQVWAEPDTAQAADWMRRLAADPEWGAGIGARARGHMQQYHSPEAVGAQYRARLAELGLI